MPLANNALVLVTDGRKTLFFRNQGDENQIDLRTEDFDERARLDAQTQLLAVLVPVVLQILDVNGGGFDPVDDEAACPCHACLGPG